MNATDRCCFQRWMLRKGLDVDSQVAIEGVGLGRNQWIGFNRIVLNADASQFGPGMPGPYKFCYRGMRLFTLLLIVIICGCAAPEEYRWHIPEGFPLPSVPEDNAMTPAKVELGRHLFYDTRLSSTGTQACASCHQREYAFTEPLSKAIGSTGELNRRNSLALVNIAYNDTLMWAHPDLYEIERQVLIPMFGDNPIELGIAGHEQEVLTRFHEDADYRTLFEQAFPRASGAMDFTHMVDALACFVRSLVSFQSPFDRYAYGGQEDGLSEDAILGLGHFFSERFECHHCHGGFNFTQSSTHQSVALLESSFHNTGLYNLGGQNTYPPEDQGLYEFTGIPADRGKFRAPTLRNIAVTAPYMHDGSLADLEAVLDFYADGGRNVTSGTLAGDGRENVYKSQFVRGFDMTPEERAQLLAFLHSLTDKGFLTRPDHQNPFAL